MENSTLGGVQTGSFSTLKKKLYLKCILSHFKPCFFHLFLGKKIPKISPIGRGGGSDPSVEPSTLFCLRYFFTGSLKSKMNNCIYKKYECSSSEYFQQIRPLLHSKHLKWKYNNEHWTWSLTSIEFYVTLFVDSLDVNIASVINTKKEFLVPNINENIVFLLG